MTDHTSESVKQMLRTKLAQGDAVLASARPVLRHLLAHDDQRMFSDEIIARIRGMLAHVARQMLFAEAEAAQIADRAAHASRQQEELAAKLHENTAFLGHLHALTLEAQLAERLQSRSGIDTVLSPLMQELVSSSDKDVAAMAMGALTAQARFMQQQRRMEMPLRELPADLFHAALLAWRRGFSEHEDAAEKAERALRQGYDEATGRLGRLSRLVVAMGHRASRALSIDHAGVAIFSTALAMASEQDRELAILSYGDRQHARLALSLRAAGLKQSSVEEQFMYLHPDFALPRGFDKLSAEQAATLLTAAQPEPLQ